MNISGDKIVLEIKLNGTYFPIGCLISNSINDDLNTLSSTEGNWQALRPIDQGYKIDFNGLLTVDNLNNTVVTYRDLQGLKRSRTKIEWRITLGAKVELGDGYITSLGDSSSLDSFISFNGEILGWGPISEILEGWITFDSGEITFDSGVITWDAAFG